MVRVELTRHLFQFFPDLEGRELEVEGSTMREIVDGMEALAPGFAFYVCDERGRLRQHVNAFVGKERVSDRTTLTDAVRWAGRCTSSRRSAADSGGRHRGLDPRHRRVPMHAVDRPILATGRTIAGHSCRPCPHPRVDP